MSTFRTRSPHHEFGGVHGGHPGPLHQAVEPEQDLLHAEGLGDIIVAAGSEPHDPVLDGVLGSQEERRHLRRKGADPAQQLNAVESGKHDIQNQDVRTEVLCELYCLRAVRRHGHGPASHPQTHAHELRKAWFIVNHQGADRGAVRMRERRKVVGHGVRSGHGSTLWVFVSAGLWGPCVQAVNPSLAS